MPWSSGAIMLLLFPPKTKLERVQSFTRQISVTQELSGPQPPVVSQKYCRTNERRTAVQMGGVLQYCWVSLASRLRSQEGPAIQMGVDWRCTAVLSPGPVGVGVSETLLIHAIFHQRLCSCKNARFHGVLHSADVRPWQLRRDSTADPLRNTLRTKHWLFGGWATWRTCWGGGGHLKGRHRGGG